MCRFVLYQGPPLSIASLVTEPSHSIISQSVKAIESEEPLNGDGFGVAWYVPEVSPQPAVFRSVSPAWSNMNLLDLARVTKSPCILAHVRAATRGLAVTELNCHPFASGPYAFMHNGDIARFGRIRRKILVGLSDNAFHAVKGSTDSEHLFGVFLDKIGPQPNRPVDAMADALLAAVREVVELSRAAARPNDPHDAPDSEDDDCDLNIAVTDGNHAVACRYTTAKNREPSSLYMHTGRRYVCEGGVCSMVSPEKGTGAVIVSSERLSDDPGWQKIPSNHLVTIRDDRTVDLRAMN